MKFLVLGFSAFFSLFLGMFHEGRGAGESSPVTQYGKAEINGSD